jgi:sugar phosphate permease
VSRYRWTVLAVGAAGTAAISALRQGLPALGPALRSTYDLSLPELGLVLASVNVGIVLTLVPWGALADRVGERPVMAAGLGGAGCALVLAALAPSLGSVVACLLVAGMLGASATGASGRAVMGWFARSERGFALGIRQMAIPLGGAAAALTLPRLVGAHGLSAALLVLAGACFACALAASVLMRDPPPAALPAGLVPAPPPMKDRRLWRLGLGSALLVVAQGSLLGFIVVFLHEERGLSAAAAGAGLAAIQIGGALARLVLGRRSDRAERRIAPIRRVALSDAALLAAATALVSAPGAVLYPVLLVAGIVAMSWNGLAFTAAAEISGRLRAGTAMSLQNTAISAAAAAVPVLFGALVETASWRAAYAVAALAPLAGWWVLGPLEADEEQRVAEREQRLAAHRRAETPRSCKPTRRGERGQTGLARQESRWQPRTHT